MDTYIPSPIRFHVVHRNSCAHSSECYFVVLDCNKPKIFRSLDMARSSVGTKNDNEAPIRQITKNCFHPRKLTLILILCNRTNRLASFCALPSEENRHPAVQTPYAFVASDVGKGRNFGVGSVALASSEY